MEKLPGLFFLKTNKIDLIRLKKWLLPKEECFSSLHWNCTAKISFVNYDVQTLFQAFIWKTKALRPWGVPWKPSYKQGRNRPTPSAWRFVNDRAGLKAIIEKKEKRCSVNLRMPAMQTGIDSYPRKTDESQYKADGTATFKQWKEESVKGT